MEESSSDSDWDSDSSRGLNTCGVSRVVHGNRLSVSGDASNDTRCLEELERNQVPLPCTNHLDHQVGPSRRFEERGTTSVIAPRLVKQGDVNLRQWLDRPERLIDHLECLHIFRQIVEIVNLAHAQGIIVRNVRPSCFVMSASNRVSFIESASCSSTSSGSCEDAMNDRFFKKGQCSSPLTHELQEKIRLDDASQPPCSGDSRRNYGCLLLSSTNGMYQNAIEDIEERKIQDGRNVEEVEGSKDKFPMKQVMIKEVSWYTTPEEVAGGPTSFYSDVYRLGVLLFELFCTCSSTEKKLSTMSNLRHRVLPPQLLLNWPKEASFCLWLLHPLPSTRPKMIEVLQSEFLNEPSHSWEEGEDAIKLREEMEGHELLLEFLLQMQQRKEEVVDQLQDNICCLSSDIKEILKKQLFLNKTGASYSELNKTDYSSLENIYYPVPNPIRYENLPNFGSRKRLRSGNKMIKEEKHEYHGDIPKSETQKDNQGNIPSKNTRMIKNFKILESAYFSKRSRMIKSTEKTLTRGSKISSNGRESFSITDRSSVNKLGSNEGHSEGRSGLLDPFLDGLCKYLSFSKMKVRAELKQGDLLNSSSLVCSLSFDRDNEFFATAGVNRKIKVFEYNMILNEDHDIHYHYPVTEMASRSKMSSICWNSYIKSQIASSDFEGVVQIWDATRGQVYMEMKEHKRRAWSVDFSSSDPTKLASGSDDGAVKLWNINQGGSISTIKLKANVCCVQFPPDSAHSLVFGSADHKVYCYDLRNTKMPWCTLIGHDKTVSYVKFIDSTTLVSASTDNTLKLWDLSTCTSRVLDNPVQTFTGHTNKKNFVGLSLCDGYIATGSETNEVFVYHKSLPMPVLSYKFSSEDSLSGQEVDDYSHFISSVCWRDQSSTLVAANSAGDIKLLEMV